MSLRHETNGNGTEEALKESEQRYRAVIEQTSEGIFLGDADTKRVLKSNVAFQKMLGYSAQELCGMHIYDFVAHDSDDMDSVLRGVLDRGDAFIRERKYRRKDGSIVDVEANASVISYNNREVLCTVVRDVTERKKAEETRLRLSAIVESSDDAIIGKTLDGIITSWNSGAERIYGYSADEAVGHPISMLVPPERPEEIPTILQRIRRGEKVDHSETMRVAKDGQRLDISLSVSPIRSPAGDIVGASTIARDITERKGAEEKIEQAEERTRFQARLLDAVGEAIISTDAEGRVVYWNRIAEQMYGWSAQEVTGQRLRKVIFLDERLADRILSELREGRGRTREIMVNRKDGTTFPVLVTNTPLRDERGNLVATIGISRDVTERKMAEEALRRSEQRFRSSFRDAAIGMALVGTDGRWLQVNRSLCEMFGYSEEELLGKTFQGITHPDDLDADLDHVRRMLTGEIETYQLEKRYLHAEGRVVWSLLSVSMVHDEEGEPLYFVSQIQDITERKGAEQRLAEAEERYRTLVERIPVVTYIQELSPHGRTTYLSPQYESIKGYTREEALSEPGHWIEILHPDDRERVLAEDERTDRTREPFVVEYRQIAKDGSVVWVRDEATLVHNEEGEPLYWLGIETDVTERKALEARLEHQALHDSLTGLPNRRLFVDRLGQALRRTRRRGRGVAVLFMDLDGFKNVNDSLGHEAGDDLLVAVAKRLKDCLRPEDTLARFGGDEFVVLLEDAESPDEPVRVAERITRELRGPFVLGGNEMYVGASIGVAMGGKRTRDPGDLLRDADTAMYRAKEEGSGYSVFGPAMHERALSRLGLENDLRRGIEEEEFVVHYQPIVNLQTGQVWGMEALVRWQHPERGLLNPGEFVPAAEESGLVMPLGEQVLQEACVRAKEWQRDHPQMASLVMSVNLSARQLACPDLAEVVEGVLEWTGLEGNCLVLDVTETVYVKALEGNTGALCGLREMGVGISIDDFGTGYSSLSYLRHLPADILKIDKSFVRGLGVEAEDTAIVAMIVDLAHTLGMEVVAEGVETEEQAALLAEMGCDMAQGYHFARPLPPEEVPGFLVS